MNFVVVVGYCAAAPKIYTNKQGKKLASFVVYDRDRRYGQNIHRCILADQRAELLPDQIRPGSLIILFGQVSNKKMKPKASSQRKQPESLSMKDEQDSPPDKSEEKNDTQATYSYKIIVQNYFVPPGHNPKMLKQLMCDLFSDGMAEGIDESGCDAATK